MKRQFRNNNQRNDVLQFSWCRDKIWNIFFMVLLLLPPFAGMIPAFHWRTYLWVSCWLAKMRCGNIPTIITMYCNQNRWMRNPRTRRPRVWIPDWCHQNQGKNQEGTSKYGNPILSFSPVVVLFKCLCFGSGLYLQFFLWHSKQKRNIEKL